LRGKLTPIRHFGDSESLQAPAGLLGGLWLALDPTPDELQSPLLYPTGPVFDGWIGRADALDANTQQKGCVRYRSDGQWVHGCAEIDDRETGLQAAAQMAYQDIFETLAATDCLHLLRLWNYFSRINEVTQGLERYRQFNSGRQQAFLASRRSALEGAPAACALGIQTGPLRVYFLAGRVIPTAIENPRQVSAYHYPHDYGPSAPTFSRAALADAGANQQALFISGTASIVGHTSLHLGDVVQQTDESMTNIETVRALAQQQAAAHFPLDGLNYTVYLRHAQDLSRVRQTMEARLGANSPAARHALYVQADVCRSELLVEIEAHATSRRPA
jgi:chorismate lyase/3-hydroxybenzoate synthase